MRIPACWQVVDMPLQPKAAITFGAKRRLTSVPLPSYNHPPMKMKCERNKHAKCKRYDCQCHEAYSFCWQNWQRQIFTNVDPSRSKIPVSFRPQYKSHY